MLFLMQCKASEIAKRLSLMSISQIIGNADICRFKLYQIRNLEKNLRHLSELEEEKLRRFVELLSLSFGIPYETESLILITEIEVISNLMSTVNKSTAYLKELGDTEMECEESDSDFFRQYALFALDED